MQKNRYRTLADFLAFVLPLVSIVIVVACSSPGSSAAPAASSEKKALAAEGAFAAQIAQCTAAAKAHMPDESAASKEAARAEYDACRARVLKAWETDAGAAGSTP